MFIASCARGWNAGTIFILALKRGGIQKPICNHLCTVNVNGWLKIFQVGTVYCLSIPVQCAIWVSRCLGQVCTCMLDDVVDIWWVKQRTCQSWEWITACSEGGHEPLWCVPMPKCCIDGTDHTASSIIARTRLQCVLQPPSRAQAPTCTRSLAKLKLKLSSVKLRWDPQL